ncbi:hypothetical protein [Zobellella maritima]|uniref:hypothetical protein n=1 Tax=Zobellella maritima TaxID=2059725 RepID=UPI000E301859|nr:hypothetical protein [Zobellella maritima]
MKLSPEESLFVARRAALTSHWPWVGGVLLLLVIAFAAWLWWSVPHLINPWAVTADLQSGALSDTTIPLMAALLPVVTLTFLVFVALTIVMAFAAFANERRLIDIINRGLAPPHR